MFSNGDFLHPVKTECMSHRYRDFRPVERVFGSFCVKVSHPAQLFVLDTVYSLQTLSYMQVNLENKGFIAT